VGAVNWSGFVVKTYDYFYRANSWLLQGLTSTYVSPDQRRAPAEDLRLLLLEYFGLAVEQGSNECAMPWFEGTHVPWSWKQMVCVFRLLLQVHTLGYAHVDILPQNIVFAASEKAWIIRLGHAGSLGVD
jgi:hypothetical protein